MDIQCELPLLVCLDTVEMLKLDFLPNISNIFPELNYFFLEKKNNVRIFLITAFGNKTFTEMYQFKKNVIMNLRGNILLYFCHYLVPIFLHCGVAEVRSLLESDLYWNQVRTGVRSALVKSALESGLH